MSNEAWGYIGITLICVAALVSALYRFHRREKRRMLSDGFKPQPDERTYRGYREGEKP